MTRTRALGYTACNSNIIPFQRYIHFLFCDSLHSSLHSSQDVDKKMVVTVTSNVARRASCYQGMGMMRAYGSAFPAISEQMKAMKKASLRSGDDRAGHAATVFGFVCGLLGVADTEVKNGAAS